MTQTFSEAWRSTVPEGHKGNWSVEKFTVGDEGRIRQISSFMNSGRMVPDGEYTRLMRNRTLVMSDTPDERRDHSSAYWAAIGDVLIFGLGLGCYLQCVLSKPEVTSVEVIEISQDVIELVGSHFSDPRLTISQGDAMEYQPVRGARWDCVWFDIWDDLCTDNLDSMAVLTRRFARRTAWHGAWGKEYLKRQRQQERNAPWNEYR
jgi:spermidine synthase